MNKRTLEKMNPIEPSRVIDEELVLDDFVLLDHSDISRDSPNNLSASLLPGFASNLTQLSSNVLDGIKKWGNRLFYTSSETNNSSSQTNNTSSNSAALKASQSRKVAFADKAVGPVRILVLGKQSSGKTSLIHRFVGRDFTYRSCSSIYNIQTYSKVIHIKKKDQTYQSVLLQFYEMEDVAESPDLIMSHLFDQILKIELLPESISLAPTIANTINGVLMLLDPDEPGREILFQHYVKYASSAYCDNMLVIVPIKTPRQEYPQLNGLSSTLGVVYQVYFDSMFEDETVEDISDLMVNPDINLFVYLSIKSFFRKKKEYHAMIQPYPSTSSLPPSSSLPRSSSFVAQGPDDQTPKSSPMQSNPMSGSGFLTQAVNESPPNANANPPFPTASANAFSKLQTGPQVIKDVTFLILGSSQSGKSTLAKWILGDKTLSEPEPVIKLMNSILFDQKKIERQTIIKRLFSQVEYRLNIIDYPGAIVTKDFLSILVDPKFVLDGIVFMLDQTDLEYSFESVNHIMMYLHTVSPQIKMYMIKNKYDVAQSMGENPLVDMRIQDFALKYNIAYLEKFTFKSKEGLLVLNNLFLQLIREKVET